MPDTYERRISAEEAVEGYVFVLKDRLAFFPPINEPFELLDGETRSKATVEARDCTCRGPGKPHQHYFIRRPGLAKGTKVRLTREGDTYRLT